MSLERCMCGNRAYYISVVSLEMRYNTFWSSFVFLTCHFLLFYINFLACISFFIAAFSIGKIVKTYFCEGKSKKQVCKGVSIRQNPLTFEKYFQALDSTQPLSVVNRGFITRKHNVLTYHQEKRGLSPFYCKRVVHLDGIHTFPLNL